MQADSKKVTRQLNIAKGQLDGISKMVDADAYCIEISNQLLATIAILKNINNDVISAHLEHCIRHAKSEADLQAKLSEIEGLLKRMN